MELMYEDSDLEFLEVRSKFGQIIESLNQIALNKNENFFISESHFSDLPFQWDLQQVYLFIEYLNKKKLLTPVCFIVLDDKMKIQDIFIIRSEMIIDKIEEQEVEFLEFSLDSFKNVEESIKKIEIIQKKIYNYLSIQEEVKKLIQNQFGVDSIQIFLIPFNIQDYILNLQIPDFNLDLLSFFNSLMELKTIASQLDKKSKLSYYLSQFNQFKILSDAFRETFGEIYNGNFDKWAQIWGSILDGIIMNIIVVFQQEIIFTCKIIVDCNKITINPLSIQLINTINQLKLDNKEIAEKIYNKTGLRTVVFDEDDVYQYIYKSGQPPSDMFQSFGKLLSTFYCADWYPNSLLQSFLQLFGLKIGPGIHRLPALFDEVIAYFDNILFITLQKTDPRSNLSTNIVHISKIQEKIKVELIESNKYTKTLESLSIHGPIYLKQIKNELEVDFKTRFNACFAVDIDVIADSLSAKNMQALIGMSDMVNHLPFIATIGGLFAGMKALDVEKNIEDQSQSFLELSTFNSDSNIADLGQIPEDKMKFVNFFDEFLKKGIMCIIDESKKSMKKIRSAVYSQEGFLGLDMDAIREFIKNR